MPPESAKSEELQHNAYSSGQETGLIPQTPPDLQRNVSFVQPFTCDPGIALMPRPGTEGDFILRDDKFTLSIGHLGKMFNPKSLQAFFSLGGLDGLEKGLRTSLISGLNLEEDQL